MDNENFENEELNVDEVDAQENQQVEENEQPVEERVPLNKFLEEKKKRKEYEKRLREFEAKEEEHKEKEALSEIRKLAKDKDFDDDTAEMFETILRKSMSLREKRDPLTEQVNDEISDLAEVNPEVIKYKKEIMATVKKFAKVGEEMSVEEAYRYIAPQKLRYNEMQTDIEQKAALRRRESYENRQLNSSSKEITSKYQLDETDRKALAGLQKYQPNAGWNEEKYFKTWKG